MAALAQVYVFLYPGEIGLPNKLIYPAKAGTGAQQAEAVARDTFNQENSYVLTQLVINHLEGVWEFWNQSIAHARSLGLHVYEKSFYGPPNCIPWIEFLGIATIIAKHHQIFHQYDNDDVYTTTMTCVDISRLRRWLRCKLSHDGFRRNDANWSQCWHIITIDKTDEELDIYIPRESVFKKDGENFVFQPEPELVLPLYGDFNSSSFEDVDVEMARATEGAAEDKWAGLLDPRLPGVGEAPGAEDGGGGPGGEGGGGGGEP